MLTDAIRYRLELEYNNGFGFQCPSKITNRAPVCLLNEKFDKQGNFVENPDYEELVRELSFKTGAKTLDWNYMGGRPIISLDWCENSKLELVLDQLVKSELNFQLATRDMPQFGIAQKDTEFRMNMIESRMCQDIQGGIDELPVTVCRNVWRNSAALDIWNWKTEEGLQMCMKLRSHLGLPMQTMDDPLNFRNWESYTNFDERVEKKKKSIKQ